MEAARVPQPLPLGLARSGQRLPLGTMLLEAGALTPEQLEVALAEKESTGRLLGEILVERGLVSSRTLAEALAAQAGLPFEQLARVEIDSTAAGLLPEKFARRYHALPVRFARSPSGSSTSRPCWSPSPTPRTSSRRTTSGSRSGSRCSSSWSTRTRSTRR